MRSNLIVGDADAIIAQANPEDSNHDKAVKIAQELISSRVRVIYPVTAIIEAVTHIQRALNSGVTAFGTTQLMIDPAIEIVEVNKQTLINAINYFSPTASKKNTLFDCVVAAIAHEYKADAIFSFDRFYLKHGFKLASNFVTDLPTTT